MDDLNRDDFSFIDTPDGPKHQQELCGWGGNEHPDLLREAFDQIGFPRLRIIGAAPVTAGTRSMLWEISRKVIGADPRNYPQETGDCVSFGAKNAISYVQFWPMANGEMDVWKEVFPPYLYGAGRVFIGGGRMGRSAGSLGVWQAKAVMEYGAIPLDTPDCPPYSGRIATQWGASGPPKDFVPVGKQHIVKSAAAVQSWDDVLTALTNGYPVTIASNVGFDMRARSDGYNHYSTHWGHQMCIIGADAGDGSVEPHACILNSWGDAHGQIKDFRTGDIWPKGTLRVRKRDIETILSEGDSFAYSSFVGFPAQELPRDMFDFV
jgi:hypothetical protein